MVDDSRQNEVHSLNVPYLGVFVTVAHQNVPNLIFEVLVLESQRLALSAIYVFLNLYRVFS